MAHLLGLLVCGLFLVVAVVGQQWPINTCWDSQKVNDELQQCIQRSSAGNVGGSTGGGSSGGGWGGKKPWTGQGNGNPAWYGQGGGNPGNGQGGNNGGNFVAGGGPAGPGSINNGGGSSYGGLNGGVQPGGSGLYGGWNYNNVRGQGSQGGSRYQPPYPPFRGQGGSNGQWGGAGGRYMTQMRCYMEIYRGTSDANNLDLVKIRDNIGRLASVDKASDLMSAFDTCAQSYSAPTNVAKMRDYDQCMWNSMQAICFSNTGSGTGGVGPGSNPGPGLNNGVGPAAGP